MDSVTGNLYGVVYNGYVFVCSTLASSDLLDCETLLQGQGSLYGIFVDPNSGYSKCKHSGLISSSSRIKFFFCGRTMYFSKAGNGGIFKADMDGSNLVQIISGLSSPAQMVVDFDSQRLFWVYFSADKVQSSNLDGTDVQLVLQLRSDSYPWGIVVYNGRLFWGNAGPNSLQSSDKAGQDVQTHYTGSYDIRQLALVNSRTVQSRRNDCEGANCSGGICVLTRNSFRCIA